MVASSCKQCNDQCKVKVPFDSSLSPRQFSLGEIAALHEFDPFFFSSRHQAPHLSTSLAWHTVEYSLSPFSLESLSCKAFSFTCISLFFLLCNPRPKLLLGFSLQHFHLTAQNNRPSSSSSSFLEGILSLFLSSILHFREILFFSLLWRKCFFLHARALNDVRSLEASQVQMCLHSRKVFIITTHLFLFFTLTFSLLLAIIID